MKKAPFTLRMTLLVILGLLNFLVAILVGKGVYESWVHYRQTQGLKDSTRVTNYLYDANKFISLSRAASVSLVYIEDDSVKFLQQDLLASQESADLNLTTAIAAIASKHDPLFDAAIEKVQEKYKILLAGRVELDQALHLPLLRRDTTISDKFFKSSTDLIGEIQNLIGVYSRPYRGVDAAIYRQMLYKYYVWSLAEATGQEYAVIGKMISTNQRPTAEQQEKLLTLRGYIEYDWQIVRRFSENDNLTPKLLPLMEEAHTHYFFTFDQTRDLFYSAQSVGGTAAYPITISMWLDMATQVIDSLHVLQDEILKETQHNVDVLQESVKKEIYLSIFIFVCAVVVSLCCWAIVVFRVARPVNAMIDALYKGTQENIFEMPKITYQHDEIGKLARVLETFQNNAIQMKRSNEELERFAYVAAHDLKSPLRAVDNLSQWLEEDLEGKLSEQNQKYIEELRRRVRLMDKLLDDTLEYARINTKMESSQNEIVNGKAIIDEIIALLDLPPNFIIQGTQNFSQIQLKKFPLQQVLYNLINNAVKHNDKEQGFIELNVQENAKEYVFSVSDNGPGIDPQYHQKIFEMFQTLARDKSKGRGMGLAMVRKIVVANGGMIEIESELEKGAIFRFTWPK